MDKTHQELPETTHLIGRPPQTPVEVHAEGDYDEYGGLPETGRSETKVDYDEYGGDFFGRYYDEFEGAPGKASTPATPKDEEATAETPALVKSHRAGGVKNAAKAAAAKLSAGREAVRLIGAKANTRVLEKISPRTKKIIKWAGVLTVGAGAVTALSHILSSLDDDPTLANLRGGLEGLDTQGFGDDAANQGPAAEAHAHLNSGAATELGGAAPEAGVASPTQTTHINAGAQTELSGEKPVVATSGVDTGIDNEAIKDAIDDIGHPKVDETLADGYDHVWGYFADKYGDDDATSTILERAKLLEANGWEITYRNDPHVDSDWGIESMVSPDGTEYNGTARQVGALELASSFDKPADVVSSPLQGGDTQPAEFDEAKAAHDNFAENMAKPETAPEFDDAKAAHDNFAENMKTDGHSHQTDTSANTDNTSHNRYEQDVEARGGHYGDAQAVPQDTDLDGRNRYAEEVIEPARLSNNVASGELGRNVLIANGVAGALGLSAAATGAEIDRMRADPRFAPKSSEDKDDEEDEDEDK